MNLAISNIAWAENMDKDVCYLMKRNGFSGLEIAPTRIFPKMPYDKISEAAEWSQKLKEEYNFVVPSMQSIWFGRQEKLFGSGEERKALMEYTRKAIDFAAVIGCKNLVFGCPRNRNCPDGINPDTVIPFFKELGDYAAYRGTVIGMEANPPIYNTNYINDTISALELIRQVKSDGFLLNLDVGTMIQNQEKVSELEGQVQYINHVHISEPGLKAIENRSIHKELKERLLTENYAGFISIEMGKAEELSVIERALKYVQEVYHVS